MDVFRWIVVVVSTVLGLGIARVLNGYVAAFKARHQTRPDWLALVLAGVILGELLQFWWAIAELSTVKIWTIPSFTLLIGLIMLLFLAAALVLPAETEKSPRDAFERDGRWALGVLAAFHVVGILGNIQLFHAPLISRGNFVLLGEAALAAGIALVPRRGFQEILTAAYVALAITDTFLASQLSYG